MFRWRECTEGHIILGLILTTFSLVCLILTTFSTPFIHPIYFLAVPTGGTTRLSPGSASVQFGAFGYCPSPCLPPSGGGAEGGECVGPRLGYTSGEGDELYAWATKAMILFGLAALSILLALITLILSLGKVGKFMWNPVYFRTTALIGTLLALLATIFSLILFVRARNKFDDIGIRAKYGAAQWLGLVGAITAFMAAAIGGPKYQGHYMYRADQRNAYNV